MAILDLDKIIFQKTNLGITCEACGGDLEKIRKKSAIQWLLLLFTLGFKKTGHYQCKNCRKKYTVV